MDASLENPLDAQLARLSLAPGRPLVVVDADEVLFHFMQGFEQYLETQGCAIALTSFALVGNIRRIADDSALAQAEVGALLAGFFADHTETLTPVPGAADALAELSERMQVVVLSNLPLAQAPARGRALQAAGMDYPIIANTGSKGGAVRRLKEMAGAPVAFVDDIPTHHGSVRRAVPDAYCVQFVADPRLAALVPRAPESDLFAADWGEIRDGISRRLG